MPMDPLSPSSQDGAAGDEWPEPVPSFQVLRTHPGLLLAALVAVGVVASTASTVVTALRVKGASMRDLLIFVSSGFGLPEQVSLVCAVVLLLAYGLGPPGFRQLRQACWVLAAIGVVAVVANITGLVAVLTAPNPTLSAATRIEQDLAEVGLALARATVAGAAVWLGIRGAMAFPAFQAADE